MTNRSLRAFSASALACVMPMPNRAAPFIKPRKTVSVSGASAFASLGVNSGSWMSPPFFSTINSPPIT